MITLATIHESRLRASAELSDALALIKPLVIQHADGPDRLAVLNTSIREIEILNKLEIEFLAASKTPTLP